MDKILIIGCGGREYSITKALYKDKKKCELKLFCIGDFVNHGIYNLVDTYCNDTSRIGEFVKDNEITMAIVGPEAFLQKGVVDDLLKLGVKCIGPPKKLAKLETDKIFTRTMMKYEWCMEEHIPEFCFFTKNINEHTDYPRGFTTGYRFDEFGLNKMKELANTYKGGYVIKASGLKSGKGVRVSGDHLKTTENGYNYCLELMDNDDDFIIEQKLEGQEFSLMSFSDGKTLKHMPLVQDFKRAYDNDEGPNTGGMGSVSYKDHKLKNINEYDIIIAHGLNELVAKHMKNQTNVGYKGIIYGSFIKTPQNKIYVIEYNCRFGDPECLNIFKILETSFYRICKAIVNETLDKLEIKYKNEYTVCRYLVPKGYPDKPVENHEIYIDSENLDNFVYGNVFPRITNNFPSLNVNKQFLEMDKIIQGKSRSIAVVCSGNDLNDTTRMVENELKKVSGPLFYRKDIGSIEDFSYKSCGVDISKGNEIVGNIKKYVENTYNNNAIRNFGDFGGMFMYKNNILVSSTDGVGTKSILSHDLLGNSGLENLGKDLVNHCVNDILVCGAKPLFFLDYFASSKIRNGEVESFVKGASESCSEVGCALIGGETAEMPDVYAPGKIDLVGTIVGTVDEKNLIRGNKTVRCGDVVIGLRSDGPHTNGFTLVRKLYNKGLIDEKFVKSLLKPHRCYYYDINKIRRENIPINGLCHITGGGLIENPKRIISNGLKLKINDDFEIGEKYKIIQEKGQLSDTEMMRVFNCGVGMLIIVDKQYKQKVLGMFCNNYSIDIGEIV